jgi:hypothetical protein
LLCIDFVSARSGVDPMGIKHKKAGLNEQTGFDADR